MEIGIIGLGDMGRLYATSFAKRGFTVNGCDLPEKVSGLKSVLKDITLFDNGAEVSRRSDLIIYSVEIENIDRVVREYGPSTKYGAIVAGQASVKTPEIQAFEKYLPRDTHILSCHSLHGPNVSPDGQNLALIKHRCSDERYESAKDVFGRLGARIIELPDYLTHDKITADTQASTHVAFESMGTAWMNSGFYPWNNSSYNGGIDTVKSLMTLRIYGGKSHVYAGLAIFNPFARTHIKSYAESESDLFKLMIQEKKGALFKRVGKAKEFLFNKDTRVLINEEVMDKFRLGNNGIRKPNSHLSLLAIADSWFKLGINPYNNLICQTPVFKSKLGITEYLFRNKELLEESLHTALDDKTIRGHDLEFHTAVNRWASLVSNGDINGYKKQFDLTKNFFKDDLQKGMEQSNGLISMLV